MNLTHSWFAWHHSSAINSAMKSCSAVRHCSLFVFQFCFATVRTAAKHQCFRPCLDLHTGKFFSWERISAVDGRFRSRHFVRFVKPDSKSSVIASIASSASLPSAEIVSTVPWAAPKVNNERMLLQSTISPSRPIEIVEWKLDAIRTSKSAGLACKPCGLRTVTDRVGTFSFIQPDTNWLSSASCNN